MRSLRLALVCDWYPPRVGGVETHVRALAEQLAGLGHQVDVLTTRAAGVGTVVDGDHVPPRSAHVRVRTLGLPRLPGVAVTVSPRTLRRVRSALAAGGYDLVHAHASVFSPVAFAAARAADQLGLPAVITQHSVLGTAVPLLRALDRTLGWTRWNVRHTAVSPAVADEVSRAARGAGGLPGGAPVGVLPNGIHHAAWRPCGNQASAVAPVGEFRVASVMRLAGRKRPRALVEIAGLVRAALPAGTRLRVRVAGDGPERPRVAREIARRNLGDVVELLGWQPRAQVCELFAQSHVFALPSVLESFGIAALEARCAGLPVVAMRAAGPAAFIRDGHEGLLAQDDADFAAQLVRLAADDALRQRIARHNAETRPVEDWGEVLVRHLDVYRDLVRDASPSAAATAAPAPGEVATAVA